MSWIFGYDFYGDQYSSYGPDRRNWADKSQAALRREDEAKRLFDDFLKKVEKETSTFPYSQEVIPCQLHLTSPCYTSFRKYVISKGCKCVRREASNHEKNNLSTKDRRNSKMYFIKITVPAPPSELLKAKAEQERKAQEQKAKKKAAEEKKRKLVLELVEKTKQEYALAVAHVQKGSLPIANEATVDKENLVHQEGSPSKRLKTTNHLVITVPKARILVLHESQLGREQRKIRSRLFRQKQEEIEAAKEEIASKYAKLETDDLSAAQRHFDLVKQAILDAQADVSNAAVAAPVVLATK